MKVVDMHCDTISALYEKRKGGSDATLFCNDLHVDIKKLQKSGYLLQSFALFVKWTEENPWEKTKKLLALYEEELAKNKDSIAPVFSYGDIAKNEKDGKISALLTVEEGGVTKGDLDRLLWLYEKGVRLITVSWNYENGLSHPNLYAKRLEKIRAEEIDEEKKAEKIRQALNTPEKEKGLTKAGFAFVERMEELHMIVDVSHLSDAGFWDVLSCTKKPFAASHSNARAVCPCVRNLTDDMIRALAERGGVIGLNFCPDFLRQTRYGEAYAGSIADVVRHAKHILHTGGEECLGLGSDFDGIDTHGELKNAGDMELLWDALVKEGFSPRQADKIFAGNVLGLYREILL